MAYAVCVFLVQDDVGRTSATIYYNESAAMDIMVIIFCIINIIKVQCIGGYAIFSPCIRFRLYDIIIIIIVITVKPFLRVS